MTIITTGVFTLGRDAEQFTVPSGKTGVTLSLAYDVGYGQNKTTGWIRAKLWGARAEAVAPYLTKGTKVFAALSDLHVSTFTKRDGSASSSLEGSISEIQLLGGKRDSAPAPRKPAVQEEAFESEDIPF